MPRTIHQKIIIKSSHNNNVSISGYASVYNTTDTHNDIIQKGSINFAEAEAIKFLWQHDYLRPIGVINSISEDDYGLKIDATINGNINAGKEAIELLTQKAISGLSVGINVIATEYNSQDQRIITKAELIEISIVTFPANHKAQIHHILNQEKNMELNNQPTNNHAMQTSLSLEKISNLEKRLDYLQGVLARPESDSVAPCNEYKTAFHNYLRKGIESNLITKSFSGAQDEAAVLLVPSLYERIINELNSSCPLRQLASIEVISTNALDVILENGKFASGWVAESAERIETNTSKLEQKRIMVHELYAQPKATQKLLDDAAINLEQWIYERLRDSFMAAENEAFIKGNGINKPKGILDYDDKVVKTIAISPEDIVAGLLELINTLDEEYLANATFLMNRVTLNEIQKLRDEAGRFIWQPSLSDKLTQTIFGIPVVCCSEIPNLKSKKPAIILADFKAAYKIVDRRDINIMRDPYTSKPFVKFYAVKRVGGDVVNVKAMSFATFKE